MPRIRCTQRLLELLGKEAVRAAREDDSEESDLDWYAHLFYLEGRKCLIFVNAGTLFPVVALDVLKDDFRDPAELLRDRYHDILERLRTPGAAIEREISLIHDLPIGRTLNRSIIRSMNDFVALIEGLVDQGEPLEDLSEELVSMSLSRMPVGGTEMAHPMDRLKKRIPSLGTTSRRVHDASAADGGPSTFGPSRVLAAWLDHPTRRGKVYTYHEMLGFMFHMIAAPTFTPPTVWIAELLGGENILLRNEREAKAILAEVLLEYNRMAEDLVDLIGVDERYAPLAEDPMDNFKEDAPVHQWARGFAAAHRKYPNVWDGMPDHIPDDVKNAIQFAISAMLFFASEGIGRTYVERIELVDADLPDVAADIANGFHEAARLLTQIGLVYGEESDEEEFVTDEGAPSRPPKVGRNEPCPCGSGRKYKHCHGRAD